MEKTDKIQEIRAFLSKYLQGKPETIDILLTCLLAKGHALIEDVPGVGKTTLAHALAQSLDGSFNRIQFTSDIIPSDITGVSIFHRDDQSFKFHPGPVFANVVLADEINRASPKSQSALLEAMERGSVTTDGETRPLPSPFMVIATQNPVDFESTFPLPQAQLDRFLMRISIGYPARSVEKELLKSGGSHYDTIEDEPILETEEVESLQRLTEEIYLEDSLYDYVQEIVEHTRTHPNIEVGVSPRGAIAFCAAIRSYAFVMSRSFAKPSDVEVLAPYCLAHRIQLRHQYGMDSEWGMAANIIRELIAKIEVPHTLD